MKIKKIKNILTNKQNIKLASSFVIGALLTTFIINFSNRNEMKINLSESNNGGVVVAKVNNENIYSSEINQKLLEIRSNLTFNDLDETSREVIVKEVYIQKILLKNALKNNAHNSYSKSLKLFATREAKENYLTEEAKGKISEESIKNKYEEILKNLQGKKEYLISHIRTKTKKDIVKAKYNLSKNPFEDVAKKFSIDKSSKNGGDIGYVLEGTMVKPLEDQISKLKVGKVSSPFKTDKGWNIIKLRKIRDVQPAELEDVKDKIKDSLINEAKKEFIIELVKNVKVEII